MKKWILLFLICFTVCSVSGCYDEVDINDLAYVIAIGIDGGKNGNLHYTFQFANPASEKPLENFSTEAENLYVAMNKINSSFAKQADYSQMCVVIFSDKLDSGALGSQLNGFLTSSQFHPNIMLAISKCSAKEFLENINPTLDEIPARYYENIFKSKYTIYAPEVRIKDCNLNKKLHKSYFALPLVDSDISGMAIMQESRIIAEATGREALLYHMLKEKADNIDFEIDTGDNQFVVELTGKYKPKYTVHFQNGKAHIKVKLRLDGQLLWQQKAEDSIEKITEIAKQDLTTRLKGFLETCAREYQADILDFGSTAKRNYLTISDWEQEDWEGLFREAEFEVEVKMNVKRRE